MAERDPACGPKAVEIIGLHLHPPDDGPTVGVDEQTGIGVRTPAAPSQPAAPGRPARREFEDARHGTAAVLAAFCVNTGTVQAIVRRRHRSAEFIELLRRLDRGTPRGQVIHLILDPVKLHCSAEVALVIYYRPGRFAFHWLPTHAAWRSFIAAWFAVLSKQCRKRSELADFAAAEQAITDFVATDNAYQAKPFTWRKGVEFYQRRKDKLADLQPEPTALPEAA
jgi:hypothetical protein